MSKRIFSSASSGCDFFRRYIKQAVVIVCVAYATLLGALEALAQTPAVVSINRASPNPTSPGATVFWTVTFNKAVTGVDASDFKLAESGVTGSVITSVTGSGSTRTVTVTVGNSDGTGNGQLELSLADNDSIKDSSNVPLGGANAGNGNFIGQSYYIETLNCSPPPGAPSGVTCVCDHFNRTNLNPSTIFNTNWIVSTSDSTGILPSIVNGRLRLTNATYNNAKAATIPAIFPAAGNYISVDFRLYSYGTINPSSNNGYGADGVVFVLSDYNVPAVPGAYGGSLGYANNCWMNGFAGGWLGVGIDEWGNFRNSAECRNNGLPSSSQLIPHSVAVRGSGFGMSGYLLHAVTGASWPHTSINPPVSVHYTSTTGPGHRYRIVVDHSNHINAWTRVERDTGNGFVTLIPPYDAKAQTGQAPVPLNWQISFTGSTGAVTNFHEIDNLRVCATHVWPLSGGTAGGFSAIDEAYGFPTAVQNYLTGRIYTKLIGQPFRLNVAALNNNQIVTGYVTSGNKWVQLKLVDNSDGVCVIDNNQPNYCNSACVNKPAITGGSQVLTFASGDQGQKQSANFTINTAYKHLVAIMRECTSSACTAFITSTPAACSTDSFSVRPLSVTATTNAIQTNTSGGPTFHAGADQFQITATIAGISGQPSGYNGALKIGNPQPIAPATVAGAITPTSFPAATPGTPNASVTSNFIYSEVGAFTLPGYNPAENAVALRGIWDDTWTAIDNSPTKQDCIVGSFSNMRDTSGTFASNPNYGKYGCLFGLTAPLSLGRFIPHHFDTEIPEHACSNAFTYSGQPFKLKVTAKNAAGETTQNYAGALAKTGTYSDGNGAAGSFSPATLAAASYSAGVADLTTSPQVRFTFANKLTAPATLKLRVTDSDNVSSNIGNEGTTPLRSGRLVLSNAHGSELLGLTMPIQTQYWTGSAWATNTLDSCTDVSSSLVFVKNPAGLPNPTGGAITNGEGQLVFPAPNQQGTVKVCAKIGPDVDNPVAGCTAGSSMPWLQGQWDATATGSNQFDDNPWAMATFGVYQGRSPIIYRREQY